MTGRQWGGHRLRANDNDNDNDNDVLFSYVTQYKGIEENQGFTNSKNTNEQINIVCTIIIGGIYNIYNIYNIYS